MTKYAKQSCTLDDACVSGLGEIPWKIATSVSDQQLATHRLKSPIVTLVDDAKT